MFRKFFQGTTAAPAAQKAPFDAGWWNEPTLMAAGYQEVVGESFYQAAIKAALAENGRAQLAQLVRDPKNKHDRNAVAVKLAGEIVGYLPRSVTTDYHPIIQQLGGSATARATITGGWNEYDSHGVVLHCDAGPFDSAGGILSGDRRVPLSTLKAAKPAAMAAVDGSALATLTVDDDGTVWAFVGETPIGKMAKAKSNDYAMPVSAFAAREIPPQCHVFAETSSDGSVKFVVSVMAVNDYWSSLPID